MKKILIGFLIAVITGSLNLKADDGFYVRAMSASTDGTFDPGEGWVFPATIGFPTYVDKHKKSKKTVVQDARNAGFSEIEKMPKKNKKPGKLATWMNSDKK
jgi:hypothetical protein